MSKKHEVSRIAVQVGNLDRDQDDASFEGSLPDLERVACDEVRPVRIDVRVAAALAHSVATRATAGVPEATLRAALQLRARVRRALTYYFEERDPYREEIVAIRGGTGYVDLGNDQTALAELYQVPEVNELLSRDPAHYHDSDASDARALACQFFGGLGFGPPSDAQRRTDLAQKAWTLLAAPPPEPAARA